LLREGSPAPDTSLLKQDGKTGKLSELKGKPTLLVFYSSWAPNMVENIAPTIKEISEFYQSKMNFAYINFDDDAKQFQKTSKALFNGFTGTNFYSIDPNKIPSRAAWKVGKKLGEQLIERYISAQK